MASEQAKRVNLVLQAVANEINAALRHAAGTEVAFVLVVSTEGAAQYVSNASRPEGIELLESLLSRMQVLKADIPAHYNPDL